MFLHRTTPIEDFYFLLIKIFNFVWISNVLCMNVPDEGYSRNAEARRANDIYKNAVHYMRCYYANKSNEFQYLLHIVILF